MQEQIDDINEDLDELGQDFQDFSDNYDSDQSDQQDTNDDIESRMENVETSSGHLDFPLTQQDSDLINELFPRGSFQLSSGSYTLKDNRISTSSTILYSVMTPSGVPNSINVPSTPYSTSLLTYTVVLSAGQAVFTSSISGDSSTLSYLLLP